MKLDIRIWIKSSLFLIFIVILQSSLILAATSDTAHLKSSITLAAKYLEKNVEEDGRFNYCINMNPEVPVRDQYNILRHAACVYVMCLYYEIQPDEEMLAAIERAGKFLQNEIGPIPRREDLLTVWSNPELNYSSNTINAKLGATGLGLAALANIEKFHPGFTPDSDLKAMGRFILFMQKPGGSFYSRYFPEEGGYDTKWNSLYYPGEAVLGLLALYEKDRSDTWLKPAAQALEYVASSRKEKHNIPLDHWALLATDKLLSLKKHDELPVSKELLISHANQICAAILQSHALDADWLQLESKSIAVTTVSTCLEGLLAALNFLPQDDKTRPSIEKAVDRGISFLLSVQVRDGKYAGAFQRNVGISKRADFDKQATEVRVDYVQHALSAMLLQYQLKKPN